VNTGHYWTELETLSALEWERYEDFATLFPYISPDAYRQRRASLLRENSLHQQLLSKTHTPCKLCAFLRRLDASSARQWRAELARPIRGRGAISHMAVVDALRDRGIEVDEASVRRHRRNHAK
jgi:hypothetical protein